MRKAWPCLALGKPESIQVCGENPGRPVASDGSRVWREHRECPPRSPGRQDGLCEGVSIWAETKWLSRSWPCLLAAPDHNLRVYGLGLCEAPCGSVWLRVAPCWCGAEQIQGVGMNQNLPQSQELPLLAASGPWLQPRRSAGSAKDGGCPQVGLRLDSGLNVTQSGRGFTFRNHPGRTRSRNPVWVCRGSGCSCLSPGRGWGPRAGRSLGNLQLHAGK